MKQKFIVETDSPDYSLTPELICGSLLNTFKEMPELLHTIIDVRETEEPK